MEVLIDRGIKGRKNNVRTKSFQLAKRGAIDQIGEQEYARSLNTGGRNDSFFGRVKTKKGKRALGQPVPKSSLGEDSEAEYEKILARYSSEAFVRG